jgi:hypothetical protein
MSSRARWGVPLVVFLFVWTLTTHGKYSSTGDEPHYLIIAESLLADGDLDLANNYEQRDGARFGAPDLVAGPHGVRTRDGRLGSAHDIGVPVALLPVYATATRLAMLMPENALKKVRQTRGLFAYSLVSLALAALTALGCAMLRAGLTRVASPGVASVVVLVCALSPPVLAHAFLVFPETLAFTVVCAVVWLLCQRDDELATARVWLVVAAVGALPWLHRKYAPLVLGLLFVMARRHRPWLMRQSRARWTGLAAVGIVPQLGLHAWTLLTFGSLGGPQMADTIPFSVSYAPTGALGMLFDRERGLAGYAPIYLLAPACWALTWRDTRDLLVPVALLFLPLAAFVTWDAGFSPAARFLVPLMPIVTMAAAIALDRSRPLRWIAAPLLVLQAAIAALAWGQPRLLWPKALGTNQILEQIPIVGPAYAGWLPSIATGEPLTRGWIVAAVVAVLTAATALVLRRADLRAVR